MNRETTRLSLIIFAGCCLLLCCCIVFAAGAGLFVTLSKEVTRVFPASDSQVEPAPVVIRPTAPSSAEGPGSEDANPLPILPGDHPAPTGTSSPDIVITIPGGNETLANLRNTNIPASDLIDLAGRFKGIYDIPLTQPAPAVPLQKGDLQTFWLSNEDEDRSFQVTARLEYISRYAYFWVEDGVRFDRSALKELMDIFDGQIYPTNREFFGSEWSPGIDNDPRIYILYARNLGSGIAGYFSSSDSIPPQAHPYSNAHEMFDVNADTVKLSDEYTRLVLAHEFQHMIHWYRDRNEETWLNEGFSELALLLNHFDNSGFDTLFAADPDLQLNTWPDSADGDSSPHYGSSFLFVAYFLDRFGEDATKALVADPENGLTSLDHIFTSLNIRDPLNQTIQTADNFFLDWVITNYLDDPTAGDGRFAYQRLYSLPDFNPTQQFETCPVAPQVKTVHQYAADYIRFDCPGNYRLHFEGSIQTNIVPAGPHSGDFMWWSNRNDDSDMALTQAFDFQGAAGPLTLDYWTWYDLEDGYDFVYVTVSEDGRNWDLLRTPSGTDDNPSGSNFGWGYTGKSGSGSKSEWIHEQVDLSAYAGKKIQLRFEYITDTAVNRNGFLLDDLSIPEIGYFSNFEQDDGGWQAAGWTRIQNLLPQNWKLALLTTSKAGTQVDYLDLRPDISLDIPIKIGSGVDHVTLVVSAATRFTTQKTSYRYWLER